ncbi:DODA-type extradiol aromatic ring-opening family dioxygenase [Methylophilus flavus]|uniref:DODA-type extradiol aromatic ring-opening family dioxygenase n=1 Tax=Methylophilus flavus TaxID=640084 RepID=A0ABW3P9E0_9PROT
MTTLFVSHGAPTLALESGETGKMLSTLAASLPKPDAILVISAHWDTRVPMVSLAAHPATIHDFAGFPAALYAIQYPAPGATALANKVIALLAAHDIQAQTQADRGLDHGAWVPLSLMYPEADIPVTQLSIQSRSTPAAQFALGQALQDLHDQNVLILASGAITHNLSDFFTGQRDAAPLAYVNTFADWIADQLAAEQAQTLLNYRTENRQGIQAHPSEDHLMPLFVAAGSGQGVPKRFTPETTYGILAMDAYVWERK